LSNLFLNLYSRNNSNFSGVRFLGASQAIVTFQDYDTMMIDFEAKIDVWAIYFNDLRQWRPTDASLDRFPLITLSYLPVYGWTISCISTILSSVGRII
jgi:hypothetical protein